MISSTSFPVNTTDKLTRSTIMSDGGKRSLFIINVIMLQKSFITMENRFYFLTFKRVCEKLKYCGFVL